MAEASPTMRVIKGLAALAVLIIGLIGVPAFLVVFIGNPLPGVADWSHLLNRLTRPDDGSGLVAIVSVAAWLAWLVLTVSVVLELAAVVSRRRFQMRIPGLAAPQRLASGLVLAVVALSATTPQTGHADPVRTAPQVTPRTVDHQPAETSGTTTTSAAVLTSSSQHGQTPAAQQPATASATHYTVQRGDDLWSLAERFYGEGREWRQIAAANPEVLTGGPDRLEAGWRLTIPDNTAGRSHSYRVRPGDTLSAIADQQLGDPDLWPELYAANRFQLDDPNELSVGVRLELPPPPPAEPGVIGRTDTTPGSSDGAGADTERDGARATSSTSATSVTEPDALPKPVAPPSPTTAQPGEEAGEAPPTGSTTEPLPPAAPDRTQPDPTRSKQAEPEPTPTTAGPVHPVVAGIAGVGGLLAAAIVAGARSRRRVQLQARPVGRRIARPSPVAQLAETHLGRRQRPMGLRTLDLATRAIAAHSHRAQVEPPQLALVTVADDRLEAQLTSESRVAPAGFQVAGNRWRLDAADVDLLRSTPGLADAVRPYPALVTVGVTDEGSQIVADLEAVRMTSVESSDPDLVEQALAAIAVELSCSPWAEELELILVGTCERLPDALGRHTVTRVDDLDEVLDGLGHRARSQRRQASRASVAAQRVDPDRADAWSPTVLVVNRRLSPVDQVRLQRVVMTGPPVSIAVVGVDLAAAPCRIWLSRRADGSAGARIEPYDVTFTPQ
ncbi:MAG TPA: LysM peptidoglycan-binding domain-containing protein, partial [Microlunatus sp.]|nr:LysM peptidoglycan-binding domain-containing protein [Microlunatus sp.]